MSDERDEATDASRRTRLASERTYLAWQRSGLAALAVGLGVAKLLPKVTAGPSWPYVALGLGFCLLALAFMAGGLRRQRDVERALKRGQYAPLEDRAA